MNVISETEYSFSNALFWNVMLHHHIRAFDEERDANFDEVWDEELVPALLASFPQLFYPLMTRQFFCDFHEKSEDFCVS